VLWSVLKIVVFVVIAALLAWGAAALLETPGEVRIAFGSREFALTHIGFIIAVLGLVVLAIILLKLVGFIGALVRFVMGDETAITRFFARNRERRGLDALSGSVLALASGDATMAERKAAKAEKLLQRPALTAVVRAQAAELNGDRARATELYKPLLANDATRFPAIRNLGRIKLEEGDAETALALAKKGFALRPDNAALLKELFELQCKAEDWAGARETLNASVHARLLPRDVATRRDAVLSLADARKALADGQTARGHEAARQANKLAPTLVPAAALASAAFLADGGKRRAGKLLVAAWTANPHPDLAAAFAALEPGESPAARRKRFETLIAANPSHAESRLLAAQLAIADEDFPAARKALGDLAETDPTTRSLALMAAVERGLGAPDSEIRGWLARAVGAAPGPQWVCTRCNHIHAAWAPVCENCGAFDTLDWRSPPHAPDASLAGSAMLPLIIGDGPARSAPPGPDPERTGPSPRPDPIVEDAEIAPERNPG